jgi:thymidylate synthase (FAD)
MKIVRPKVELWTPEDNISHVARCARVCYAAKTGRDDKLLCDDLIKSNHISMLRHDSYYYIMSKFTSACKYIVENFTECPYIEFESYKDKFYVATNGQFILDHPNTANILQEYEVNRKHFVETEIGHKLMRYTFNVITQVSTSRELNRVSPNNIAEQSTRYCNYSRGRFEGECAICQPHWFDFMQKEVAYYKFEDGKCHYIKIDDGEWHPYDNTAVVLHKYRQPMLQRYLLDNDSSCRAYLAQIADGMEPQDARGELPLDLATEVVYTYSIKEWRHILDLRYYGKTGKPHPNAKIIAGMIKDELDELGYDFK